MPVMTTGTGQVHLVGGGVDTLGSPALLAPFVEAALARGGIRRFRPRLALVLADVDGSADRFRPAYVEALEALAPGGFDHVDVFVGGATPPDPALLGRTVSLPGVAGVERAVGIDEDTCLRVCDGARADAAWEVTGSGFVWDARSSTDGAVTMRRLSVATAE
jgi:hypothetical protein